METATAISIMVGRGSEKTTTARAVFLPALGLLPPRRARTAISRLLPSITMEIITKGIITININMAMGATAITGTTTTNITITITTRCSTSGTGRRSPCPRLHLRPLAGCNGRRSV